MEKIIDNAVSLLFGIGILVIIAGIVILMYGVVILIFKLTGEYSSAIIISLCFLSIAFGLGKWVRSWD